MITITTPTLLEFPLLDAEDTKLDGSIDLKAETSYHRDLRKIQKEYCKDGIDPYSKAAVSVR